MTSTIVSHHINPPPLFQSQQLVSNEIEHFESRRILLNCLWRFSGKASKLRHLLNSRKSKQMHTYKINPDTFAGYFQPVLEIIFVCLWYNRLYYFYAEAKLRSATLGKTVISIITSHIIWVALPIYGDSLIRLLLWKGLGLVHGVCYI